VKRMRGIGRKENVPYPEIEYTDTHFYIVFQRSKEYLKMISKEPEKKEEIILNERQNKFIDALRKWKSLTREDYEKINNTSKRTAIRDLKDLVSKMIIGDISTSNTDPNKRYKLIE